jgi:PAS domain S-box-containing protein
MERAMNTKLENGDEQPPSTTIGRGVALAVCNAQDSLCPFEAIFEQVAIGIAYVATNGQLLRVNRCLCDITGYTHEELLQHSLLDFTPEEEKGVAREFFRDCIREKAHGRNIEKQSIRKDGSLVWISVTPSLVKKATGEPDYLIVVVQDISEQKRVEEERYRLEQRTQATTIALREANQRMDEFLSIASHELKNPLAAIKGNVQLAERRLQSAIRRWLIQSGMETDEADLFKGTSEALGIADRQVSRLNRLVGDLLDISRIQVGKMEMHLVPSDVRTIVREAVESQRLATSERVIHLIEPEIGTLSVMADADRIEQVVINYLANAIKYSPDASPVEVSLSVQDDEVLISVRDEGPGLPGDQHQLIWDRFHQVSEARKQLGSASGLGLGLYISKTIIEQHHGRYGVQSAPGTGSIFWFSLPMERPETS